MTGEVFLKDFASKNIAVVFPPDPVNAMQGEFEVRKACDNGILIFRLYIFNHKHL